MAPVFLMVGGLRDERNLCDNVLKAGHGVPIASSKEYTLIQWGIFPYCIVFSPSGVTEIDFMFASC